MHFFPDGDIESEMGAMTPATDHQTIMRWEGKGPVVAHMKQTILVRTLFGYVYQRQFLGVSPTAGVTCVVGLGGGALCHLFVSVLNGVSLRAVEVDQAVVTAACEHFALPLAPKDIHVGDAGEYFSRPLTAAPYSCVVLDLFGERPIQSAPDPEAPYSRTVVPPLLLEETFYRNIWGHLTPSVGILIVNFVITAPEVAKTWLGAMRGVFGSHNMTLWFASQHQGVVMCVRREAGDPPRPSLGTTETFAAACAAFEAEFVGDAIDLAKWM